MSGPAMANSYVHPHSAEPSTAAERHYTPSEIGDLWRLNVETVRRLFQNEPGVVRIRSLPWQDWI
jgi:hypothetical protein